MRAPSRMTAAVVGGLMLLGRPSLAARAQSASLARPVAHIASIAAGSIQGIVQDERGAPVAGAMVSALGATTAFAVTDRSGRFELRSLSPGPYLVRAHLSGFVAPRGQVDRGPPERARLVLDCASPASAGGPCRRYPVSRPASACPGAAAAPAEAAGTSGPAALRRPRRRRSSAPTTITARPRGGCATRAAAS